MLTDGDPEMSNEIRFASVRGIARRGGGILAAIAVVSLMPACSKEGAVAATNATVNAALTNLDSIATGRPEFIRDKADRRKSEPPRVAGRP